MQGLEARHLSSAHRILSAAGSAPWPWGPMWPLFEQMAPLEALAESDAAPLCVDFVRRPQAHFAEVFASTLCASLDARAAACLGQVAAMFALDTPEQQQQQDEESGLEDDGLGWALRMFWGRFWRERERMLIDPSCLGVGLEKPSLELVDPLGCVIRVDADQLDLLRASCAALQLRVLIDGQPFVAPVSLHVDTAARQVRADASIEIMARRGWLRKLLHVAADFPYRFAEAKRLARPSSPAHAGQRPPSSEGAWHVALPAVVVHATESASRVRAEVLGVELQFASGATSGRVASLRVVADGGASVVAQCGGASFSMETLLRSASSVFPPRAHTSVTLTSELRLDPTASSAWADLGAALRVGLAALTEAEQERVEHMSRARRLWHLVAGAAMLQQHKRALRHWRSVWLHLAAVGSSTWSVVAEARVSLAVGMGESGGELELALGRVEARCEAGDFLGHSRTTYQGSGMALRHSGELLSEPAIKCSVEMRAVWGHVVHVHVSSPSVVVRFPRSLLDRIRDAASAWTSGAAPASRTAPVSRSVTASVVWLQVTVDELRVQAAQCALHSEGGVMRASVGRVSVRDDARGLALGCADDGAEPQQSSLHLRWEQGTLHAALSRYALLVDPARVHWAGSSDGGGGLAGSSGGSGGLVNFSLRLDHCGVSVAGAGAFVGATVSVERFDVTSTDGALAVSCPLLHLSWPRILSVRVDGFTVVRALGEHATSARVAWISATLLSLPALVRALQRNGEDQRPPPSSPASHAPLAPLSLSVDRVAARWLQLGIEATRVVLDRHPNRIALALDVFKVVHGDTWPLVAVHGVALARAAERTPPVEVRVERVALRLAAAQRGSLEDLVIELGAAASPSGSPSTAASSVAGASWDDWWLQRVGISAQVGRLEAVLCAAESNPHPLAVLLVESATLTPGVLRVAATTLTHFEWSNAGRAVCVASLLRSHLAASSGALSATVSDQSIAVSLSAEFMRMLSALRARSVVALYPLFVWNHLGSDAALLVDGVRWYCPEGPSPVGWRSSGPAASVRVCVECRHTQRAWLSAPLRFTGATERSRLVECVGADNDVVEVFVEPVSNGLHVWPRTTLANATGLALAVLHRRPIAGSLELQEVATGPGTRVVSLVDSKGKDELALPPPPPAARTARGGEPAVQIALNTARSSAVQVLDVVHGGSATPSLPLVASGRATVVALHPSCAVCVCTTVDADSGGGLRVQLSPTAVIFNHSDVALEFVMLDRDGPIVVPVPARCLDGVKLFVRPDSPAACLRQPLLRSQLEDSSDDGEVAAQQQQHGWKGALAHLSGATMPVREERGPALTGAQLQLLAHTVESTGTRAVTVSSAVRLVNALYPSRVRLALAEPGGGPVVEVRARAAQPYTPSGVNARLCVAVLTPDGALSASEPFVVADDSVPSAPMPFLCAWKADHSENEAGLEQQHSVVVAVSHDVLARCTTVELRARFASARGTGECSILTREPQLALVQFM